MIFEMEKKKKKKYILGLERRKVYLQLGCFQYILEKAGLLVMYIQPNFRSQKSSFSLC